MKVCSFFSFVLSLVIVQAITGCVGKAHTHRATKTGSLFLVDTLDIGTINPEQLKYFTVTLSNQEASPINVTKFVSSCDCVVIDTTSITIPPHSNQPIQASFKAKAKEHGTVLRTIALRTNRPVHDLEFIVIRAMVTAE